MVKCLVSVLLLCCMLMATGCAATVTALRHKDLDVQTQMSKSVFLDPTVNKADSNIYVRLTNTTAVNMDDMAPLLVARLQSKGMNVVADASQAHYILQINVLSIGMMDKSALEKNMNLGFGGVVVGATIGALAAPSGHGWGGAGVGGLIWSIGEVISGTLVKEVNYSMITDLQITEGRKVHNTRIGSTATQVNLEFEEAYPSLRDQLVESIVGMF